MRLWAAHAVFAAVLVGSLASGRRPVDAPIDGASFKPIVVKVALSQGLRLRERGASDTSEERTLAFDAPGCSEPVLATWRLASFEDEAIVDSAPGPGYRQQYIYIDQKWDSPNPRAISIQRMKYGLLAMFGLTRYAPSAFTLEVETPRDCPAAASIDWRAAWGRDQFAKARAKTGPAPQ